MEHQQVTVIANRAIATDYFALDFQLPPAHQAPAPGQFLTLRVSEGIEPLLRRPFAYAHYDAKSGQAGIIYERRGKATQALTALVTGDTLDYLGPLGNTFPLPTAREYPVLVGGGIGMGPILHLRESLKANHPDLILAIGSRNAARLPELPPSTVLATDDGSRGFHGTILAALQATMAEHPLSGRQPVFYSCGPTIMMENLAAWAAKAWPESRVLVSLEQTMACAVGACMGCVVKTHHARPYARVCTEGPVFNATEIAWREA